MRAAGAKRAKREGSKTRKPRQQLSKEEKALRASGVLRRNIKKVMTWCINGTSVYGRHYCNNCCQQSVDCRARGVYQATHGVYGCSLIVNVQIKADESLDVQTLTARQKEQDRLKWLKDVCLHHTIQHNTYPRNRT